MRRPDGSAVALTGAVLLALTGIGAIAGTTGLIRGAAAPPPPPPADSTELPVVMGRERQPRAALTTRALFPAVGPVPEPSGRPPFLVGITLGASRAALIAVPERNETRLVAPGDTLLGYRVARIAPKHVLLVRELDSLRLELPGSP